MIDPSLTLVWRRRAAAALVDLALSVGVLVALVWLQVERFTRDAGGFFGPDHLDRMATLERNVDRSVEVGGTRYVLAGGELVMTVVVAALTTLAVYVLLPGLTGTSPGKRLFGLRVVTTGGDVVDLPHAATRAVVGVLDLLPIVAPWALGALVARRSPLRQRLGDKVAGTVVVDARRRLAVAAEGAASDPATALAATEADDLVVDAVDAADGNVGTVGTREADRADRADAGGGAWLLHDVTSPMPSGVARAEGRPGGHRTEARRTAPPPQHRGVDRRAPDAFAAASPPTGTGGTWPRPRAERAPVWDPAAVGTSIVASAALPAAPARPPAGGAHPQRRVDDPRPAPGTPGGAAADLADRTGRAEGQDRQPTRVGAPPPAAEAASGAAAGRADASSGASPATGDPAWADQPVWNEDWQAWLFFDRTTDRWHRHDPATGTWDPIG